jgi:hypothetical protein
MTVLTPLAANPAQNNFGDTMTGGLAGPMGLFVIVVLVIGTVLLIRNMNSRLRRLPTQFPSNQFPSTDAPGAGVPGAVSTTAEPAGDERAPLA